MITEEFLSYCQSLDVRVWVEGEQLHYNAPEGTLTLALKSQLRERKLDIIKFLQSTVASSPSNESILPVSRDTDLPLSFAQSRMWFLERLEVNGTTANLSVSLKIHGSLQVSALKQSLMAIVERHEILRTSLRNINGQAIQVISPTVTLLLPLVDLRSLPAPQRQAEAQRLATEESRRPFNLAGPLLPRVTLLQLGEKEYILLLTLHHVVTDGWSIGIFFRELKVLYQAFTSGKPVSLPKLPIQYADFASWQRQFLQGVLERELSYWQQQLQGAPTLLQLPTDRPRPAVQTFAGKTQSFVLSKTLTHSLRTLSQQAGVTLFMTLLAGFSTLLYRYTGQEDILVGSPTASRNRVELEGLMGCFINTLVLRTDLSGNPSFRKLLKRVGAMALGAYAHQNLPFEKLVEALQPARNLSYSPLFQVMFVLQHASFQKIELPGLILQPSQIDTQTAQFDLTLNLVEEASGLTGKLEYNTDLFNDTTIARTIWHFQTLLAGIVVNPDQRLSELPLLTLAEQHQLLLWNQKANDPTYGCIHHLLEAQVEQTPNAVAVALNDQQLTYQELNQRANQLAHYLQKLGVGPDVKVGLCVERSLEMVIGLLGILKAGGAYVPVDPAYPQERLAFLLSDSQVLVLLTQAALVTRFPSLQSSLVCLDADWTLIAQESNENPASHATAENLAYIVYTSGSTGKPKGVMIPHQSLVNFAEAAIDQYVISPRDRILQFASISFDAAAEEIFSCLIQGATLVLRTDEMLSSIPTFLQRCDDWQLTVLDLPTVFWHQMVAEPSLSLTLPDSVRLVIIGGEKALPERLTTWQQVTQKVRLVNTYGPTEATVVTTAIDLSDFAVESGQLPIGTAIGHAQTYILDPDLQPVPVGIPGELYIGGAGVARGYSNRPDLTALAFIPDPFGETPGARLYKTGDRVRYRTDGTIEFLGRFDSQVKLRGFRIELEEIAAALRQHPRVQEAVVVPRSDEDSQRLVAYIVPHSQQILTITELRGFLELHLPKHMLPAAFVMLEALPLTPNGKVDRQVLPAPEQIPVEAAFVAPRTTIEKQLAVIWKQVLGLDKVGVNDNFFELGGDSILSLKIIAKANQSGLHFTPKQLFQYQTIAQLAAVGTTKRVHAEQGAITGSVPLTPIQHWFFAQKQPEPHHWNQAVLLDVKQSIDAAVLAQVVQFLQHYHDVLRLRFIQEKSGIQAIIVSPEDEVPLTYSDLSALPSGEQAAAMAAMAAQLQASLNLSAGPLFRVALFDLGHNQPCRVLWVIHHLVVDWVSWQILLEDLQTAYQQFSQGKAIQLPPKTTSFKQWSQRLQDYAQSSGLHSQLDYWLAHHQTVKPIPLDYAPTDNTAAAARTVSVSLSAEETQLLQQVPSVYRAQINDVLLTALTQAFAQWTGENALLIDLEGHGREELFEDVDLSRTVGWFTSIFPVHLSLENTADPGKAVRAIKEQLRAMPNRGMGYGVLRYLSRDHDSEQLSSLPNAEVIFNYLGQTDPVLSTSSLFRINQESSIGLPVSWRSKRAYLLDISGSISQGRLQVNWTYSEKLHRHTTVEMLAQGFIKALRSLINHCQSPDAGSFTPSDFAEFERSQWSQSDIDAIAAAIEES